MASGDPLSDAVILWTRVSPGADDPVEVWWEIAVDTAFEKRVQVGTFSTDGSRDFTVKVDVGELDPGRTYYYRFKSLGRTSPVGRTRTAPSGAVERLRFGVASCASLGHGYFHAYRALAEELDLDAVIHLGDYIYEYGSNEYGMVRDYEPAHEIVTLEDYRLRHSQYKREADLAEAHRQHPFIVVWDDHESANNSWKNGAENHQPDEGEWKDRKAAAIQAYFEWMPIRETADRSMIWRKLPFGDLADLVILDTRLWGRDEGDGALVGAPPADDPNHQLLGEDQEAWLEEQVKGSAARWKILGQQVMVGNLIIVPGMTLANPGDQWHGYPSARKRFIDFLRGPDVDNVVVLTGDIHSSWANELVNDPNDAAEYDPATGEGSAAVEFVTPAITSPGIPDMFLGLIDTARAVNPHIRYVEPTLRGYMVVDLTPERASSAWYHFADITNPDDPGPMFATAWTVADGETRLTEESEAPTPRSDVPAAAP